MSLDYISNQIWEYIFLPACLPAKCQFICFDIVTPRRVQDYRTIYILDPCSMFYLTLIKCYEITVKYKNRPYD